MPNANFVDTKIFPVVLKAGLVWRDDKSQYAYLKRRMNTLLSISENQTARFTSEMKDADKDCRIYKMFWLNSGGSTSASGTGAQQKCVIPAGPKGTSSVKNYFAQNLFSETFTVSEMECNDIVMYEDVLALKILDAKAKLRQRLNEAAIVFLNSNAATSVTYTKNGTLAGNTLTYPTANWSDIKKIMYSIARVAEMDDLANPVLLNGENLDQVAWTAMYQGTNGCCVNDKAILDAFGQIYWDHRYLESTLANEQASFLFDANRIALLNDWHFDNDEAELFHKETYQFGMDDDMISIGTQKLRYDVSMTEECQVVNGKRKLVRNFEMSLRYGFYTAPTDNPAKTGIIKLVNA